MEFFSNWLQKNFHLLKTIHKFALERKVKLYVVGGILRDILLKREKNNLDIDFCLKEGAIDFARDLARSMQAGFVVLDDVNKCGRVVIKDEESFITLDFADFRAETIEEDLRHRDFTVNSLALGLSDLLAGRVKQGLIDPCSGVNALKRNSLKMTSLKAFDEDPLRIMRAFSMPAVFGLAIDKNAVKLAKAKRKKLKSVSAERIRDELFKILSSRESWGFLMQMDRLGILEVIFPEVAPMRKPKNSRKIYLDILGHTLITIKHMELIINKLEARPEIKEYFERCVCAERNMYSLVKLAALLHDVGKPKTCRHKNGKVSFYGHERLGAQLSIAIGQRLKLSNDEIRILRRITFLHLRPGYLVTNPVLTARAKFRFFRDSGSEAVAVLLLSLADQRATKGYPLVEKSRKKFERVIKLLVNEYFAVSKEKPRERLFDGNDLMKALGLEPSPLIGRLLRELEELQAIGKISSKEEAIKQAARLIKKI